MQIVMKSIVGAALMLGAAQAFALTQADIPPQPITIPAAGLNGLSDTDSPLLVVVWDPNTTRSLVLATGLEYGDLAPSGMSAEGLVLDFGTLSGFTSTFSDAISSAQTSRLQYGVIAIDAFTLDGYSGMGLRSTGVNFSNPGDAFNVGGAINQLSNYIAFINNSDTTVGCNRANPCIALSETHPTYFGSTQYGSQLANLANGAEFSGAVGTALAFYDVVTNEDTSNTINSYAGTWLLDATGHLVYSVEGGSTPVPLPAAGWLLLSSLGALGVIGRRKKAVVETA